jgi:D-alanyl-lipoteichoic acid acyltransferase DltB (MBOAT superfamily)
LAKKLFLADPLAGHADPIYAKAAAGVITIGEGWTVALAFPLQIYFDFSAYSDMAIGLALLFGFVLPFNFAVPYRAASLRDFWRRWHMTLSRFLRDYLYIPLGGSHQTLPRHLTALLVTMVLGGLWHGAGWTFVLWGAAHGVALAIGVAWRRCLPAMPAMCGWALLMVFLIATWVLFRAPSLAAAGHVYNALLGNAPAGEIAATRTIMLGAAFALLGPASQDIVERLRPWPWLAPVAAVATALVLLRLNDGPSYEFIYFRF